jgi:hypothetical protein
MERENSWNMAAMTNGKRQYPEIEIKRIFSRLKAVLPG